MVTEGRQVRSRILEDLQRRRDAARSQVEILLDGRDRLLGAYARVRAELDEVTTALHEVVPAADEPEPVVPELDELAAAETAAPDEPADPDDAVGPIDENPPSSDDSGSGPEHDQAPDDTRAPAPPVGDEVETQDRPSGDVDALFARLRGAERADPEDQPIDGDVDAVAADGPVDAGDGGSDGDEGPERVPAEFLAPAAALEARTEALEPLRVSLSRALKRLLADEQNEVLDRIRRTESVDVSALYPEPAAHVAGYADVSQPALAAAAADGARAAGADEDAPGVDVGVLAQSLAEHLVEPFRRRAERAAEDVGASADEFDERLRALYREWKVTAISQAVDDALLGAYARGTLGGAAPGSGLRWFVDPAQGPCPDAQDNALEGVLPAGEAFPTGDPCPQAHPGCRCLLVVEVS